MRRVAKHDVLCVIYYAVIIRAVSRLGYVLVGAGAAPARLAPARLVERLPLDDSSSANREAVICW